MNKIYKSLLAAAVVLPSVALTGCIEETVPTGSVVSTDQIMTVPGNADAFAQGMPAYMNTIFVIPGERHWDFGYPSMMIIRDVLTGDKPVVSSGYNWFSNWFENTYQGEEYVFAQTVWWYYYKLVQSANETLGVINKDTESAHEKMLLGEAYGFRALAYLDLARMYEYLPTDGTSAVNKDGNNVTGLTVPIVKEGIDEAQARNNPRATHDEMFEFILSDLDAAEKCIDAEKRSSKVMPDLACIYGLKARLYMWDEDYTKAREYARKAIDTSGCTPLTSDEWTDPVKGFNDLSSHSWMWGQQYVQEDPAVLTGIINWTSWASNEFVAGYSAAGPYQMIDKSLYDAISNDDCRKLCFVAPEGHPLAGKEKWLNKSGMVSDNGPITLPPYASLKIRPGQGEMQDPTVGCAVGVPTMRVEEMIFIEAECAAHANPAEGKSLIESFMKRYRNPNYSVTASDKDQVVAEIILQKRVEFFLEGQSFFDIKRLNYPVTRRYEGTNFYNECAFNTTVRPAWMNLCIVRQEADGNPALQGKNNPDPSECYASQISAGSGSN